MLQRTICVLGVAALAAAAASPQQRPDLSGTWAATSDAPAGLAAAPTPVFGAHFELRHKGDSLAIVRTVRDVPVTASHVLDGRETRAPVPGPLCQGDGQTVETAAWDGDAVVLTIVGSLPPGATTVNKANVRRIFRLQSPDVLLVEGTAAQGGKPVQVGTVYRRSEPRAAAANPLPSVAKTPATIAQVEWIAGVWIGPAGQSTVEERWTPPAGGSMIGLSRTLRNTTMPAFEFLCIVERDGTLAYTAMPNGRMPPTYFVLTTVTTDSVTFENPSHDFPKMVRYAKKPDGSLETTVAGEGGQRAQSVVLKRDHAK